MRFIEKFWLCIMPKLFYLFVFTHYLTQNRFALLLEMLKKKPPQGKAAATASAQKSISIFGKLDA